MKECPGLVYFFDGSFEGLMTAVFEIYSRKEIPSTITEEANFQMTFGQQECKIITDPDKARRVETGLIKKVDRLFFETVVTAFLSCEPEKTMKIFRYIQYGLRFGKRVYQDIAHDDVLAVNNMVSFINREAHLLKGFIRFSLREGGVYYAKITPKNSVVPVIMPHFSERYSVQPFLIHDEVHHLVGAYQGGEWYLVESRDLNVPPMDATEMQYRRMWKSFYETIAIPERENPRCRRTNMPMRYWRNLTEMSFLH